MKYLKDTHMLCLELNEAIALYKADKVVKLRGEVAAKGLTFLSIAGDMEKMKEVADAVVARDMKHKEQVELFAAITFTGIFFPPECLVCIPLKDSFNFRKDSIATLDDLKNAMKESTLTDFGVLGSYGLAQFQLKRYQGELETENLFAFIREKLKKYGNDLGKVSLLVLLQGNGSDVANLDFKKLHRKVQALGLKFDGDVLVQYNERGRVNVVNQIYPELKTSRKDIDPEYLAGEFMYAPVPII